ncbi:unnamed protein product [Cuscuta epithymum]|uniref:Uncharacterized protein n=1 Tax=Cuscuta epithymum TaxID=186058 RepID=A0AAV0D4C8_9ASTE|nr:unnamed protein product [Cuscuta epithymum]
MELGCIGPTLGMRMLGSGVTGSATGRAYILVRTGAVISGNSSGASNMALALTSSGMQITMLANILQTKCMVLGSTDLEMDIDTREPGMREGGKVLALILSGMSKLRPVTGKMGFLTFQVVDPPWHTTTVPKCCMPFRAEPTRGLHSELREGMGACRRRWPATSLSGGLAAPSIYWSR